MSDHPISQCTKCTHQLAASFLDAGGALRCNRLHDDASEVAILLSAILKRDATEGRCMGFESLVQFPDAYRSQDLADSPLPVV
jgi:hypothetical protein